MADGKLPAGFPDGHHVRPQAAWELLHGARTAHRTVYLWGSVGAGKTSLAAELLAKRPCVYLSLASGSISELDALLAAGAGAPRAVVLDDLYVVSSPADKAACERAVDALSVREDIWLLLLSRAPVPKWLKPAFVRHDFLVIGEDALNLTGAAQARYFASWGLTLTQDAAQHVQKLSHGNPLFLRICAMRIARLTGAQQLSAMRADAQLGAIEEALRDIWDYYDVAVFDQWNLELQEFLEAVSVVEEFDLEMARLITKKKDALRLIERTKELGDLLRERRAAGRTVYTLRGSLRSAMFRRLAAHRPQPYLFELYHSAGACYELAGDTYEALHMYELCGCDKGISRVLIERARHAPGTGGFFALRRYYLTLHEESIRASAELMAGMSVLQSMLLNVEESERWYAGLKARAKELTGAAQREAQALLLYLDIVLPHRDVGQCAQRVLCAERMMVQCKMALPEISISNNMPSLLSGARDFSDWAARGNIPSLETLAGPLVRVLGKNGRGVPNLARAEYLLERGADDYGAARFAAQGRLEAENGGAAELVFVALGILVKLALLDGRTGEAREMLADFARTVLPAEPKLAPNFRAMEARFELYTGHVCQVYRWLESAPDENAAFDATAHYLYLTKARACLMAGRLGKALLLLDKLVFFAEKMHRPYITVEALCLRAVALQRLGQDTWPEQLQRGAALAEDYGFVRVLTLEGAALWDLLRTAPVRWRDAAFGARVMAECEQTARFYPAYLQERPENNVLFSNKALKILRLQAQGLSVDAIAAALGLSRAGVKYYNQDTYRKLGVKNRAAAVTEARNRGIL